MNSQDLLDHAQNQILPYWFNAIDSEYGGFFSHLMPTGAVAEVDAPKGLVQHARMLWSFAYAYEHFQDDKYKEMALIAYKFIDEKFWDRTLGGYYYYLDRKGIAIDDRKHLYAHSFVLYGLCQFYAVTQNSEVKQKADRLFNLIIEKGHDLRHGGYVESFRRDWSETDQIAEYGVKRREKTMNTHIHLLEAFTAYAKIDKQEKSLNELKHMMDIILDKVFCPIDKTLCLYFEKDWVRHTFRYSFGHDIETSWLLQKALEVSDYRSEDVASVCTALVERVTEKGLVGEESVINEWMHAENKFDNRLYWWVQAEALVGYAYAFQRTGNDEYLKYVEKIWSFCLETLWDKENMEWFEIASDIESPKSGLWKTPYHVLRSLIETGRILTKTI